MAVFRLLHLSDVHVSGRVGRVTVNDLVDSLVEQVSPPGSVDLLDATAKFAYDYRSELDAILITGDLSHVGSRRDLMAALGFVEAPVAAAGTAATPHWPREAPKGWHSLDDGVARPTLKASDLQVLLFPGNHDRFLPSAPDIRSPGAVLFDEIFGEGYWDVGQGVKCLPLQKDGENLTIVAADCTLRKIGDCILPGGHLSQGRAYPDLVSELSDQSRTLEGSAVLWALHFPPDNRVKLSHRLLDGERVLAAAEGADVEFVLAGHLHEFRRYPDAPSRVEGFCAASAAALSRRVNSIHLLRVEVQAQLITSFAYSNFDYSVERGNFACTVTHFPRIARLRQSPPPNWEPRRG